jgi:hypothetical protein
MDDITILEKVLEVVIKMFEKEIKMKRIIKPRMV